MLRCSPSGFCAISMGLGQVAVDVRLGAMEGLTPTGTQRVALVLAHPRFATLPCSPLGRDFISRLEVSDAQSCQIRRPHRGRFHVLRTNNRDAKNVRLKLHEQIVPAGASIDTQFGKLNAGVGFHRCENVRYLVGDAFKGRPGDMARLGAARETDYPSLRV